MTVKRDMRFVSENWTSIALVLLALAVCVQSRDVLTSLFGFNNLAICFNDVTLPHGKVMKAQGRRERRVR